jgi:hypothetical protein
MICCKRWFRVRMGSGVFVAVWPLAMEKVQLGVGFCCNDMLQKVDANVAF